MRSSSRAVKIRCRWSNGQISGERRGAGGMRNTREARRPWIIWGTMVVSTRMAVVVLLMADANNALSTTCSPGTVANTAKSCTCLCVSQQGPRPRRWSSSGRHGNERARAMSLGLFGLGGGGSGSKSRDGSPAASKAERAVNSNATFKRRMSQYAQGAITAGDLVRSLERDVVVLIPGCDLEDAVAAALDATPDKRKQDLLSKASGGRAIGPGGATRRLGASRGGRSDVTVEGGRGQQYLMSQGGERISSGKSSIFNGVEVGKEGTPLKIKVTTRSNVALVAAEVSNLEQIRARNGAGAFSKHFVGFEENIDNYNGRGDFAMVMRAGSTDLRKLAEVNGGGLPQNKLRKYGAAMASAMRCVHKAGLVWTDLKVDNFVLCERDEAKAIDLEGAVPARSGPKSYTPATMPPDFVIASRGGFAGVTVDRSFDVWSLGMAVLHLYMGRSYFQGSSDPQTIAAVGQPQFTVDLSGVTDGRTRGLLEGLLNPDPKKRLQYFDSVSCRLALL